jgi:tRNA(Ile)-lysidine synthase
MADADRWASRARGLCERWNVRLRMRAAAGLARPGESVEAWARRERYRALARMARDAGASLVLLGHHLHDQAETVLLQALRGAGPAGLAAMPRVVERDGLTWARPWIARTGAEIDAYVAPLDVDVALDPSNADPRFARSRLARAVMPALRAAFPEADAALAAVARRAGEARAVLDEVAAEDLLRIGAGDDAAAGGVAHAVGARRMNALRAWLAQSWPAGAADAGRSPAGRDRRRRDAALAGDGGRVLRSWRGALAVVAPARASVTPAHPCAHGGALSLLRCDRYAMAAGTARWRCSRPRSAASRRIGLRKSRPAFAQAASSSSCSRPAWRAA